MSTVVTLGPVGFKPTGAYDNTREYKKLDVVIYQGSCYIAKSDSIGQLPTNTTYWEMLVQKGDTGNGITSIAKTGTSGLVDTYTITYTDETTSTFTVTNGEKGDPGEVTEEQLDEAMARANMVYNALPKVSDEGDNLTLDGTANCPMKMELKGNIEQTTYTGKNLFSGYIKGKKINSNDGSEYDDAHGAVSDYIPLTFNNNSYVISGLLDTLRSFVCAYNSNKEFLGRTSAFNPTSRVLDSSSFSTGTPQGTGDIAYIKLSVYEFSDLSGVIDDVDNAKTQLESGSTATSYEPYVGSTYNNITPSPNPDYPQDVKVVTGNNSVKVIGKNLFDKDSTSEGILTENGTISTGSQYVTSDFIEIDSSKTYTKTATNSARVKFYDANKNVISTSSYSDIADFGTQLTFTAPYVNARYIRYCVNKSILDTQQLEQGSTATSYEPYQSQTYPINLGTIELCKIGTYQDYIYKDNGKWYKHSEIGKYVYNNDLMTNGIDSSKVGFVTPELNIEANLGGPQFSNIAICNMLQTTMVKQTGLSGTTSQKKIRVYLNLNYATTYDEARTIFANGNLTIYYVLATPTDTQITDTTLISQLNAIENAVSYDTQTNIVQENYSEPFIINAECVRSLKDIFELIQ